MASLRRFATVIAAVAMAAAITLGDPTPPAAQANVVCDAVVGVGGGIGNGNPVGDACDALTGSAVDEALEPIKDAAGAIGHGVFEQVTSWAADGAVWLLGEVVELTEKTTSPNLLSKGFLRQYRQMASIAVTLALLMVIFAVLESLGRGEPGMLWRVLLVNVPLAAIATSAAYVVVQLLIVATDGFCEVITQSAAADTRAFFKDAIKSLSAAGAVAGTATGATAGKPLAGTVAGTAAVPLFVGFLAAIVTAFAAFFVWVELLMRDAAIYAVALFMPFGIAASIWPRWASALRRTAEMLIVLVSSKFVIVAIIALAASLLANTGGDIEHVLAAGALLLLACFAPLILFHFVPFAEGAVGSAFHRQGASGASVRAMQIASPVQTMHRVAHSNWAGGSSGGGAGGGKGGGRSSGGDAPRGRRGGGGGSGSAGGEAAGASGSAGGAVTLPVAAGVAAAKKSGAAAERLAGSGTGQVGAEASTEDGGSSASSGSAGANGGGQDRPSRPRAEQRAAGDRGDNQPASSPPAVEPTEAGGGKAPTADTKPPRPSGDVSKPDAPEGRS